MQGKEDKKQMSLEFISIIQDDDNDKMVCENVKKEQAQANIEMILLLQDNNEVVKEGVVLNYPNLSDVRRKSLTFFDLFLFLFILTICYITHKKAENKKQ